MADIRKRGDIPMGTAIFAAAMMILAVVGLVFAYQPRSLTADDRGVRWRLNGKTTEVAWDQITGIGVAHSVLVKDRMTAVFVYGARRAKMMRRPMIGLRVRPDYFQAGTEGTRAYLRGFTGYDFNIPNEFGVPAVSIVGALQERWKRAKGSAPSPMNGI